MTRAPPPLIAHGQQTHRQQSPVTRRHDIKFNPVPGMVFLGLTEAPLIVIGPHFEWQAAKSASLYRHRLIISSGLLGMSYECQCLQSRDQQLMKFTFRCGVYLPPEIV